MLAAGLAGAGSAAVWTFGRDLLTSTGGLSGTVTAVVWVVLGAAGVLGALSGDAVRVLGPRGAWVVFAGTTAVSTAVLALGSASALLAALAAAAFGGAYTAASGVLIAWAAALGPDPAGATTATLFVALTAGQALGSVLTGLLTGPLGPTGAFLACATLLAAGAGVLPRRSSLETTR
ncbi:hypothetical protein [Kineococcus sp. SYSU DK006]|uniref:hypothetical protein n=1 Tax=Kineococcus sp. SYSU DK006 TaxID=3383127 RepID=UPI003D7D4D70